MGGRRGVTSPRRHPSVQHGTWCSDAAWKSLCPQPKLREAEQWGRAPAPFLLALPLQPPWARRGNLLGCSLCPTSSQLLQDVGYEHTRAYRWVYPPQQLPGENRVANASSPAFPPPLRLSEIMCFPTYCFPASPGSWSSPAFSSCFPLVFWSFSVLPESIQEVSWAKLLPLSLGLPHSGTVADKPRSVLGSSESFSQGKNMVRIWERALPRKASWRPCAVRRGGQPGDWHDRPFRPRLCGEAGLCLPSEEDLAGWSRLLPTLLHPQNPCALSYW